MPGRAAKVVITERQQQCLQTLARSSSCPQGIAARALMILLACAGQGNEQMAAALGCERHAPGKWRRRWAAAFDRLVVVECVERPSVLVAAVTAVLSDAPRPGPPPQFAAEQVTQLLAVACEPPEKSGRPVTHWTPTELADEVKQRGLVSSISPRQIGRFVKSGGAEAASQPLRAQRQPERPRGVPAASRGGMHHLPGGSAPPSGRRHAYRQYR